MGLKGPVDSLENFQKEPVQAFIKGWGDLKEDLLDATASISTVSK